MACFEKSTRDTHCADSIFHWGIGRNRIAINSLYLDVRFLYEIYHFDGQLTHIRIYRPRRAHTYTHAGRPNHNVKCK